MSSTPELHSFRLVLPEGSTAKQVMRWAQAVSGIRRTGLSRLTDTPPFIVTECWSTAGGITYRLRMPAVCAEYVVAQLRIMVPGARVMPEAAESAMPRLTSGIELGLRRPSGTLYVPEPDAVAARLLASISGVGQHEAVVVQLVASPAVTKRPPEPDQVARSRARDVLLHGLAGGNHRPAERQPTRQEQSPDFLAVVRIGVTAAIDQRASALLRDVRTALTSISTTATGFAKRAVSHRRVVERIKAGSAPLLYPGQLSVSELAGLTAWPLGTPTPAIAGLPRARTRHLPATGAIPSVGGPILLRSDFPGDERKLCVTPADLTLHTLVSGRTGTGKTTLLCSVAEQLIRNDYGIVLIETKGDETGQTLFHSVLERIPKHRVDDVVIVDVADQAFATGYNVLGEGNPRVAVESLCGLFDHLYRDRGVYSREAFYHGLSTLASSPGYSFVDLLPLFDPRDRQEEAWRDELVGSLPDPELRDFWRRHLDKPKPEQARFAAPLIDRAWQISSRPELRRIFGQSRSSFSFREALERHRVVLINLSGVGEATALLAGVMLSNSLWSAIKAAKTSRPNFVFFDEWAKLLDIGIATDEFLARCRGYRTGLFLASQEISGLPPDVRNAAITNCATQVVLSVGHDDRRLFAREFGAAVSEEDFRNLGRWQAIARLAANDETHGPVTGITLPPSKPAGLAAQVRAASRRRYSRPVDEVEAEIRARRTPRQATGKKKPTIGRQKWS